jgi:hypothetical protein
MDTDLFSGIFSTYLVGGAMAFFIYALFRAINIKVRRREAAGGQASLALKPYYWVPLFGRVFSGAASRDGFTQHACTRPFRLSASLGSMLPFKARQRNAAWT